MIGCRDLEVVDFERLGGHKLRIRFSDGSVGERDYALMAEEAGRCWRRSAKMPILHAYTLIYGALTWARRPSLPREWLRREMAAAGELGRDAA